ncbi:MAG: CBS domain-containing protein, partial [Methanobacteriaceae archaeon]|nr:CBS domain-containing protein [Methanobacteriaceae archaeon]
MKVKEAMNQGVISINAHTSPLEAFEKMYKEGVRRLFVMDEDGSVLGVVSYSDLIGVLGAIKPTIRREVSLNLLDIMSKDVITISAADG